MKITRKIIRKIRKIWYSRYCYVCISCEKWFTRRQYKKFWGETLEGPNLKPTGRFAWVCECGHVISYEKECGDYSKK